MWLLYAAHLTLRAITSLIAGRLRQVLHPGL
jgi:hypothetical protein